MDNIKAEANLSLFSDGCAASKRRCLFSSIKKALVTFV